MQGTWAHLNADVVESVAAGVEPAGVVGRHPVKADDTVVWSKSGRTRGETGVVEGEDGVEGGQGRLAEVGRVKTRGVELQVGGGAGAGEKSVAGPEIICGCDESGRIVVQPMVNMRDCDWLEWARNNIRLSHTHWMRTVSTPGVVASSDERR